MFRKLIFALAATAALAGAGATPSRAAMLLDGLDPAATAPAPVEEAAVVVGVGGPGFYHGGQSYCWYDSGWRGPGWYWCGYALRAGYGWGGGAGWMGHYWRGGRGVGYGNRVGHGFVGHPGRPHPGGRPHAAHFGHAHGGGFHARPHGGGGHGRGGHGGGGHRRR